MKQHTLWALAISSALLSACSCKPAVKCTKTVDCQSGQVCTMGECRATVGTGGGPGNDGGGGTGGTGGTGGAGGGRDGGVFGDGGDGTMVVGFGPDAGGFTIDGGAGGTGEGVKLDPNGFVVLNQGAAEFYFMWIANDAQGWVSKYDTRTGREVGRYFSVIPKDCSNSAGPPCAGGAILPTIQADRSWHPSRTALDLYGDMFVANRGIGQQGSVTKIANDPSSCIDRNGNGTIQTSRDINGDGQISPLAADGEMIIPSDMANPNTYDECVLFTKPVGGIPPGGGVGGRALAVSAGIEGSAGDVWVGIYFESRMYKMSSANGELLPVAPGGLTYVPISFGPYGAIVDRLQRLWVVEPGAAHLALINTLTGTLVTEAVQNTADCASYAIGIDGKNRVWLPGWARGAIACRYDHTTGTWTKFDFSAARSQINTPFAWGRGIAVDANGRVFMSGYGAGAAQLIRFDAETGAIIPFGTAQFIDMTDANTTQSIGVGLDADGHPWVNNGSGNASKVDNLTGAITRTPQQPSGLYTYSDFTGYQLRNFTAPRGTYRKDFEACDIDNEWRLLTWDVLTPPNTSLQVYVKAANTQAELSSSSLVRYGAFTSSPVDLVQAGVPRTKYLRVEFVLRSVDGMTTPVLRGFNLTWLCGGIN